MTTNKIIAIAMVTIVTATISNASKQTSKRVRNYSSFSPAPFIAMQEYAREIFKNRENILKPKATSINSEFKVVISKTAPKKEDFRVL